MNRKELIEKLWYIRNNIKKYENGELICYNGNTFNLDNLIEEIEQLDEPKEPNQCEFIRIEPFMDGKCSNCDYFVIDYYHLIECHDSKPYNYCPNCGAKINRT